MELRLDNALLSAAFKEGVKEAMLDPEFRRELFTHVAEVAAGFIWLTRAEVAAMVGGRCERTVTRWAKRKLIEVNDQVSAKDPLYSLRSVQKALEDGAIRARKATSPRPPSKPAPPMANGHPTPAEPLRAVSIVRA